MRKPRNLQQPPTPYEEYRRRTFNACGLFDVAAISEGMRRQAEAKKARQRRPKPDAA